MDRLVVDADARRAGKAVVQLRPGAGADARQLAAGDRVELGGRDAGTHRAAHRADRLRDDAARGAQGVEAASAAWREVAEAAGATDAYVPLATDRVQLVAGQRLRNGLVMLPYTGYDLATAGVR